MTDWDRPTQKTKPMWRGESDSKTQISHEDVAMGGEGVTVTAVPGQRNLSVALAAGHESKSKLV